MRTSTSKYELREIYKQEIKLLNQAKELQKLILDDYKIDITLLECLEIIKEIRR